MTVTLRRPFFCSLLLALALFSTPASTQDADEPDPPGTLYRTGDIAPSEEQIRSFRSVDRFRGFLPDSVNLSGNMPPVGSQGDQGSCVGWSVGYAARSYYVSRFDQLPVNEDTNVPSPAYIYGLGLLQIGTRDCNNGMPIPLALDALKSGVVNRRTMPYNEARCPYPLPEVRSKARDFRIRDWLAINPAALDTIKGELSQGHPVVFGMRLGENFVNLRRHSVYRRGRSPYLPGSHAMTLAGYDEQRQAFLVINSWGRGWGNRGYAWIDYNTFANDTHSAYVMRPLSEPRPKPQPKPVVVVPKPVPPKSLDIDPKPTPVVKVVPKPAPEPQPQPQPVFNFEAECSKVSLTALSGGRAAVEGFVGREEDLQRVKAMAADQNLTVNVSLRPWPQCEALMTLDKALSSDDNPQIKLLNGSTLKAGETAAFEVTSPARPSHLHVAYIQADGSVLHLVQSDAANLKTYDRRQSAIFGDGRDGRALFRVAPPFGRELVLVLASRAPLFPEPRPQKETERDFLTALRKALLWKPDGNAPERDVSAAYAALETKKE